VVSADARHEKEQPVDAVEGVRQRRGLAQVTGDAFRTLGQSGSSGGVADQDPELGAFRVELAGELAPDVPGGAGDQ
jgi:hypothetical protein